MASDGNICRCGTYIGVNPGGKLAAAKAQGKGPDRWRVGPRTPRLINTRIPRLDGMAKASGKAKYPSDIRPQGMLFGTMLYSPYANATIVSIDTSAAEKMPGVKAVLVIAGAGKKVAVLWRRHRRRGRRDRGAGRDAVRAIKGRVA